MRLSGFKISVVFTLLAVSACGKEEKQDTVYDYYVEDGEFEGSNAKPSGKGGNADATKKNDARFRFVAPNAALTSDGSVDLELQFTEVEADATWSVYYAKAAESTNGTAIAIDLPVSQTKATWDTTDVAAGDYYLYATLKTAKNSGRSNAGVTIKVDGEAAADDGGDPENKRPTLSLAFPNGENVLVAGVPEAIKFAGTDADGDELKYKIEYSPDGGVTWTMVAENLTETSYEWNVQGLAQGITYKVRVTADDGNGGTAQATSAKAFGVATKPMTFAAGFGEMLAPRCGGCHAAGGPNQGTFRSDNFALANIGVSDKMNNIKARIEAGTMPPAGALGPADKAVLTMWLWDGAQ